MNKMKAILIKVDDNNERPAAKQPSGIVILSV